MYEVSAKISPHAPQHWIQSTHFIESLELLLTEKRARYHKTCFHKYCMKNKRSSEGGSQKVERSRAKRKSSTETVAPVEYIFCQEKERDLSKIYKKEKKETVSEITRSGRIPQVFRV